MRLKKYFSGQATLEYILITLVVAAVVFFGFKNSQPGVANGGASSGNNYNFVESSRNALDQFTNQATRRINHGVTSPF